MNPDQLAAFGRSLYGERWQTALAIDLNVADRTMRRWLSGETPIGVSIASELRDLLLKRLGRMGGLIGYSINPTDKTMLHHQTGAWFQYDDDRVITLLNASMLESDIIPLIHFGAEEALRQQRERDPKIAHTWINSMGRGESNMEIEVEYKGCVMNYPRIRLDTSGWVINLGSNNPHLFNKLGGRIVIIKSHVSLDDAIAQAKRRVDEIV